MSDARVKIDNKKVDTKEFSLPETTFIRDIEDKVFQSIVLQCLSQIDGISLAEGNFIDHLLGRDTERLKGIQAQQNDKTQTVQIKIEVNILYGISIPEKAEEIQMKIADDITNLTGLHVASVHIVFKNVLSSEQMTPKEESSDPSNLRKMESNLDEEFPNEF